MASNSRTRTMLFREMATLAAVWWAAFALLRPDKLGAPSQSPRGRRRLKGLGLRNFNPQTVKLRTPRPVVGEVMGHLGLLGPHIAPTTFVTADPGDLHRFPYRTDANSQCVRAWKIVLLSDMIKDLYHKHGIRLVPRNGFLLGIIRHGGFLPNEKEDDDLSVVYSDLQGLVNGDEDIGVWKTLGEYRIMLEPTDEDNWVNWKGRVPGKRKKYKYFSVQITKQQGRGTLHPKAMYSYRDTGGYFYPRLDRIGNHEQHIVDGIRWNKEGADLRLVDTDELVTEENYADGKQMGNYFNTDLSCTTEVQFYFTTIYVPCDYEAIIMSQFGTGWRHVERRGPKGPDKGRTHYAAERVSEEENQEYLEGGPRPICSGSMERAGLGNLLARGPT